MSISKFLSVKRFFWKEQLQVIARYYPKSFRFACIDLALGLLSLFVNPYRACRKYWEKQDVPFPFYGETPLTTLETIITYAQLKPGDVYLEFGSGRGKGSFWVSQIIGCSVIGVEIVPYFFRTSHFLSRFFRLPNLRFIALDMEKVDVSKVTFIYLDATGLSEAQLICLSRLMEEVPRGAKIVTVSNPILSKLFNCAPVPFPLVFPWGKGYGYLQEKIFYK